MAIGAFYEGLRPGDLLPALTRTARPGQELPRVFGVKGLSADSEAARAVAQKLGVDPIHTTAVLGGVTMLQFVSEMVTNWLPDPVGWVRGGKLKARFTSPVHPGEAVVCRGRVREVVRGTYGHHIICDVWIENTEGKRVVVGEAHVRF